MPKKFTSVESLMLLFVGIVITLIGAIIFLIIRVNQIESMIAEPIQTVFPSGLANGVKAPSYTGTTLDGTRIDSNGMVSEDHLLIFSSISCHYCQHFFPYLRDFIGKYPTLKIIMFTKGTKDEIYAMLLNNKLEFDVFAWDQEIADKFQVPGTPYVFFIDAGGIVLANGIPSSLEDLENLGKAIQLK